jgi:hypothetical protein
MDEAIKNIRKQISYTIELCIIAINERQKNMFQYYFDTIEALLKLLKYAREAI